MIHGPVLFDTFRFDLYGSQIDNNRDQHNDLITIRCDTVLEILAFISCLIFNILTIHDIVRMMSGQRTFMSGITVFISLAHISST